MKKPKGKKLSNLKDWEKNPREISEKALGSLKHSLAEFGDLSGIVFNIHNQRLVCGHQRKEAILKKWGDLPITNGFILLPTGEKINYREVNWDEKKHTAANLAANSQYLQGVFTTDIEPLLASLKTQIPKLYSGLSLDQLIVDLPEDLETHAGSEPRREENLDSYLNSAVKQIVIYVEGKDYAGILKKLETLSKRYKVDNHSDVILLALNELLKFISSKKKK